MSLEAGFNCLPRSWWRRALTPPYGWNTGLLFTTYGASWPSSSSAEQSKMYNLVVLAVRMFKPNPLSSMVPHSKIYLDLDGDFSLTALDLKENISWWWVDINVLSMAYFEDKARGDARKAEADAARTAEEPQLEPAPPLTSMAIKRAGIFGKLYEKIPGI